MQPSPQPDLNSGYSNIVVLPLVKPSRIVIRFLGHFSTKSNPYRFGYGHHSGVDYYGLGPNNGLGDDVVSIADGIVVMSSPTVSPFGYGNLVVVKHPQFGIWSRYAHLGSRAVKVGTRVTAGQKIGEIGTSGTDNVHLHLDIVTKKALSASWRWIPRPGGFSKKQVLDIFTDPLVFFKTHKATNAAA
jgi:murein DD-endopeptidase MepM/ murein hydrolase activator NlpD